MSLRLTARSSVALATVSASLLGALVSAPAAGAATWQSTLDYTCRFPLMRPQPLKLKISAEIPATVVANAPTGSFKITASAAVNDAAATALRALFSTTIEGSADAAAQVVFPDNTSIDVGVPTTVPKQAIPTSGGFETNATGSTLSLRLSKVGRAKITVGDLVLRLTPRSADGELTGLSEFETECFQVPGQNNQLATIDVTSATGVTPTPTATAKPPVTPTPAITATATAQPPVTPTPTTPSGIPYSYGLSGSATLKTLTKGTLPLSGAVDANLKLSTGDFTAKIGINETQGNLVALGFLPVSAKVQILPLVDATGNLSPSTGLTAKTQVRIKLPEVKAFGIPLGGGKDCQAKNPSQINLTSPNFDALEGGTLSGVFAISDLTGCGFLNGIISPLTAAPATRSA
ncbi:MAG: hypothetical protein PGN13_08695 [Patulibacter minatonensis]